MNGVTDEREFLYAEEARIRTMLNESVDDLKQSLKEASSLELWAKSYPWVALGVAIAGGFTAATLVTPAKGETFGEKISKLVPVKAASVEATTDQSAQRAKKSSVLVSLLISALFELAKNYVSMRLKSGAAPQTDSQAELDDYDGEPFDPVAPPVV
jgi:hypothetical protein